MLGTSFQVQGKLSTFGYFRGLASDKMGLRKSDEAKAMDQSIKQFLKPDWKKIGLTIFLSFLFVLLLFLFFNFFNTCFATKGGFKSPMERVPVEEVIKTKPYCRVVRGENFLAELFEGFGFWISETSFSSRLVIAVFALWPLFAFGPFHPLFILMGLILYFFWFLTFYSLASYLLLVLGRRRKNKEEGNLNEK